MSASNNVHTSSTPATASTLRPRAGRLISGLDEGDEAAFDPQRASSKRIASPVLSPFDRRSISPIPSARLSTSASSRGKAAGGSGLGRGTGVRGLGADSPTSLERMWGSSWSAIQGIASDLLGNDAKQGPPLAKGKVPRTRRSTNRLQSQRASTSVPPSAWGPRAPTGKPTIDSVGAGTKAETEAAFRAQKRKDLLSNQQSSYADSLGRFKRRTSDEGISVSAPPGEYDGREAMVYLHHVQKGDTLAGITIKYDCSANTLRRANRMWPNDTVQTRPVILLPVDACGVKGRPIPAPEEDLLGDDENAAFSAGLAEEVPSTTSLPNGQDRPPRLRSDSNHTNTTGERSSSVAVSNAESEPPWHHDSWVLLPGFSKPSEVARLSRRSLGYFPPARRKSNTFSDAGSPPTSFDHPRGAVSEALNHPAHSRTRSTSRRPAQRERRLSNANNGYFPAYLAGPGGVGTMERNVHAPGPAQDGLNKMFAKHLPDVAPPRNQHALHRPDLPLYADDDGDATPVASGAATPGRAGVNRNLENVGGTIEAWVRRVASKAKDAMEPAERQRAARASVGTPGRGAGGIGELIEMTDEFEIGSDEDQDDHVRGRQGSLGIAGATSTTATSYFPDVGQRRERSKLSQPDAKLRKAD